MTRALTTQEARVADLANLASEVLAQFADTWREESVKHSEARLEDRAEPLSPYEEASVAKVRDSARNVRDVTAALSAMIPGIVIGEEG